MFKITLVSAPFGPFALPSIGLSILKEVLKKINYNVSIEYSNIRFAKEVGEDFYSLISNGYPSTVALTGEFLFSTYFYEKNDKEIDDYIENVLLTDIDENKKDEFIDVYKKNIEKSKKWIQCEAKRLVALKSDIYGFTSMFQQNMCSFSLAREIKKLKPAAIIIFGGPNFESPMGIEFLRNFDFIDAICSGEGEQAFVGYLNYLKDGNISYLHKNIYIKGLSQEIMGQLKSPQVLDLDELPFVNYDDYFSQLKKLTKVAQSKARLLFETSRGCWWGEKSHCIFCGLNGISMNFRSKSSKRALAEIQYLNDKYQSIPISVVDNIIDYKYFNDLLLSIPIANLKVDLFYETKANLKKDQIRIMKMAGINKIQPGIESLSSNVLKIMKKGVKAIQNICLLKWCMEEDVIPEWNMLWGFPTELPEDYYSMHKLIPSIFHFNPPISSSKIRLDRFSPLYEKSNEFGLKNVLPYTAYNKVYSFNNNSIEKIAYYFDFLYGNSYNPVNYIENLKELIENWKVFSKEAYLLYLIQEVSVFIFDNRILSKGMVYQLPLEAADFLILFDKPINKVNFELDFFENRILKFLIDKGILIIIDDIIFNVSSNILNLSKDNPAIVKFARNIEKKSIVEGLGVKVACERAII